MLACQSRPCAIPERMWRAVAAARNDFADAVADPNPNPNPNPNDEAEDPTESPMAQPNN